MRRLSFRSTQSEIIPLSSEQERLFTTGAAIAMSSSDGHQRLTEEASRINIAVQNIQRIFLNLTLQLSGLDSYFTSPQSGPFAPRLVRIHEVSRAPFLFWSSLISKNVLRNRTIGPRLRGAERLLSKSPYTVKVCPCLPSPWMLLLPC